VKRSTNLLKWRVARSLSGSWSFCYSYWDQNRDYVRTSTDRDQKSPFKNFKRNSKPQWNCWIHWRKLWQKSQH